MSSNFLVRNTFHSLLALSAFALTSFAAYPLLAQDKPKPEPVVKVVEDASEHTLKRVYVKGEVVNYKFNVKVNANIPQAGGQVDVKLTMLAKETAKEVKDDLSTVTNEFPEALADLGGMEVDISSFLPVITSTRTKEGAKEVKLEGGQEDAYSTLLPLMNAMEQVQSAFYPQKAVKVGDTWKIVKETKDGEKVSKTDLTVTFSAVETIDDVKTMKLSVKGDRIADKDKLTLDYSLNYDEKSGKLLKGKLKAEGTATGFPLKLDATVTQQPTEKKADK